jgi:hypothetical protein
VNEIEIYRSFFLVRSGQQEGLSFTNTDLVQNVEFFCGRIPSKNLATNYPQFRLRIEIRCNLQQLQRQVSLAETYLMQFLK